MEGLEDFAEVASRLHLLVMKQVFAPTATRI